MEGAFSKFLKPESYYNDRYDRLTVGECRWVENFHVFGGNPPTEPLDDAKKKMGAVNNIALYFAMFYAKGRCWENKKKTIQEWMERDEEKDRLFNSVRAPEGIRCLNCQSLMAEISKDLYDWGSSADCVLFMYECPNKCLPRRAFYDNGEEYRVKPNLCPKCGKDLEHKRDRTVEHQIVILETCPGCGYTNKDIFDFKAEKKPDPDFTKDKERFCLTDEQGREYLDEKSRHEQMKRLVDSWNEKEKNKDLYDAVAKIKKLTVIDLGKLLISALEKENYISLQMGIPEIDRMVVVPFTVQDSKSGHESRASEYDLNRLIKKTLDDTNWRLMSDGVSYRLGILTGRLRGYESEEDLLKLVK